MADVLACLPIQQHERSLDAFEMAAEILCLRRGRREGKQQKLAMAKRVLTAMSLAVRWPGVRRYSCGCERRAKPDARIREMNG